ncbi:MAG: hypothetical protein UW60_C0012G0043 [Candidatus Woesebacteria bacterium GW2011_GWA2_44_33]|uniref:(P)ppGpp synthetase I, SpoT/RelA n=3 Tax=Microgenomates group TaxID=1794810 RepID=A0A0G1LEW2_9BACT|nr:MAG: hypothetical protein UW60_C0012G0043 [Candidatus Woesebacteria bacterium GW2011_GWA2_44_33]KKT67824.1 MAG: hypothetical protein UW61_C0002G0002 [Candidatus Curtissbacteria bacterium GW2011_GWC1_44_33]
MPPEVQRNVGESIQTIEQSSFGSERIREALVFGEQAHRGQKRRTGEPYFEHCKTVANIILGWGIADEDLITAALLHDTLEDTQVTLEELRARFGKGVAALVDGVSNFRSETGRAIDRETLRKVFDRSYIDPRVAVLKMADRLHNMQTLGGMPEAKRTPKAKETLEVYAKLAESLGMWKLKVQLEDLAFSFFDPEEFTRIKSQVDSDPRRSPLFIDHVRSRLVELLREGNLAGEVDVKVNGYWAIKKKREVAALQGKSLPNSFRWINDLVSFRVLLAEKRDCYTFLGVVNHAFSEDFDEERFDEFLARPRDNGYSAIQTTVNFSQGATEIAITTRENEAFNDWGVVELLRKGQRDLSQYVLKLVFTPSGVWFLKKEATGIDLAHLINPRTGIYAEAIVINNKRRSLSTVIPNATEIEMGWGSGEKILSQELLGYTLPATRKAIEDALIRAERERLVQQGKEVTEKLLAPRGILDLEDLGERAKNLFPSRGDQSLENLYFLIGGGYLNELLVTEELDRLGITKESLGLTTVRVLGVDQEGILADLSSWIKDIRGNIIALSHRKEGRNYSLRLVVEGLDSEGEKVLFMKLEEDPRFDQWLVV